MRFKRIGKIVPTLAAMAFLVAGQRTETSKHCQGAGACS